MELIKLKKNRLLLTYLSIKKLIIYEKYLFHPYKLTSFLVLVNFTFRHTPVEKIINDIYGLSQICNVIRFHSCYGQRNNR